MPRRSVEVDGGFTPRHYQLPYMLAMDAGCKFAVWVCHRRAGKDRTALAQAARLAMQRVGLYWHCLPTLKQARRVVWDGITSDGRNLIKATFPREIIKKVNEDDMKLTLINDSIIQLVGADNFDSLVGANPINVVFSEWALTDPRAYDFVRPILRENKGAVSFIYTPRGYNHGWTILQTAKKFPGAFVAVMGIKDTGVLSEADIDLERALGMPEDLIQQEYYVDFSTANVGAIVGKWIAQAEREGRVNENAVWSPGSRVIVSSDIGYRDTASWWWWQLKLGGFDLIHYDEASGLDAQDWITRLKEPGLPIDKLYLPHDAKAKTMASRHTVIEQMALAFDCEIVPQARIQDRINAARMVLPRCDFHLDRCARGLEALRAWSFKFDDERKTFSREPLHDWASHGADAFSYGAQVVQEVIAPPDTRPPVLSIGPASYAFNLDELHADRERGRRRARW